MSRKTRKADFSLIQKTSIVRFFWLLSSGFHPNETVFIAIFDRFAWSASREEMRKVWIGGDTGELMVWIVAKTDKCAIEFFEIIWTETFAVGRIGDEVEVCPDTLHYRDARCVIRSLRSRDTLATMRNIVFCISLYGRRGFLWQYEVMLMKLDSVCYAGTLCVCFCFFENSLVVV